LLNHDNEKILKKSRLLRASAFFVVNIEKKVGLTKLRQTFKRNFFVERRNVNGCIFDDRRRMNTRTNGSGGLRK